MDVRLCRFALLLVVTFSGAAQAARNQAPYLPSGERVLNLYAPEGQAFEQVLPAFVDPEGAPLTYSLSGRPRWLNFDAATRRLHGTPPFETIKPPRDQKRFNMKLLARDARGKRGSLRVRLDVADASRAPVLAQALAPQTAYEDQPFAFTIPAGTFVDPEGLALRYAVHGLHAWMSFDPATLRLSGTPSQAHVGETWVEVAASDPGGTVATTPLRLSILATNDAPTLRAPLAELFFDQGRSTPVFGLPGQFQDEDHEVHELTLSFSALPAWVRYTGGDYFYGEPRSQADIGSTTVGVTATDPAGASVSADLVLTVRDVPVAPRAGRGPTLALAEPDQPFHLPLPADLLVDDDGDALTYRVASGPAWIAYDAADHSLVGTPARADASTDPTAAVRVDIEARDPGGLTGTNIVWLRVIDRDQPPRVVAPLADRSVQVGQALDLALDAVFEDPEGEPLTLSVAGLPAWVRFDAGTARLTGTPRGAQARPRVLRVTATDARGRSAHDDFTLTVTAAGVGARLTGSFRSQAAARMDSDINDPRTVPVANDRPGEEQVLGSTPVILGGWVSSHATRGVDDAFADEPDYKDAYRVHLEAGQVVTLRIADHDGSEADTYPDLDLYLLDVATGREEIQYSVSYDAVEQLVVEATGEYLVMVWGYWGASNYTLAIEPAGPTTAKRTLGSHSKFVPGEVVVALQPGTALAKRGNLDQAAAALGLKPRAGSPAREMLLGLDLPAQQAKPQREDWLARALRHPVQGPHLATLLALKDLRRDPAIARAEPNFLMQAHATPSDPLFAQQWAPLTIGAPRAWDLGTDASAVVVAVVDSGIVSTHPDFTGNLRPGFDFVLSEYSAMDGDGIDPDPEEPVAPGTWGYWHGSHVAGIIGARGDDGYGIAGMAWRAALMPVRVLGRDGPGTSYDILQGVRYAAGLPNDSGRVPARAAQVINISIGGEGHSEASAELYRQLQAAGIFVVASAGNANTSVPSYPASYPGVYSVSATERLGERTSYSNYGPHIALAAPGGDHRHDRDRDGYTDGVLSTVAEDARGQRDPGWARFAGTSMAAPHVAGTLALMLAQAPDYTPADFDADLAAGLLTQDLGPQGHAPDGPSVRNDDFGWGLLDAQRAVLRARARAGGALTGSVPVASPSTLRFGATESVLSFTLAERGTAGANVLSVSSDADWLVVAPQAVSEAGFGTYTASVARGELVTGLHQARISVGFDAGAALVLEVAVRVALPTSDADDNGRHWVVLLDPVTLETLAADEVVVADGVYHFDLGGVAPGDYLLYAGTDRDSDGYLCDPGEACTALSGVETPGLLHVGTEDLAVELPATAFQDATATGGVAAKQLVSAPLGFHRSVGRERGVPR